MDRAAKKHLAWFSEHRPASTGAARKVALILIMGVWQLITPSSGSAFAPATRLAASLSEPVVLTACTVQPRRRRDLIALARAEPGIARDLLGETTVATPTPPPAGVAADPEIVASVTATARELAACYNAGDLRRLFALYSEEYLYTVWGGFAGANPSRAEIDQTVRFISTPAPQPESARVAFISVEDVRQLPHGEVSAIVNLSSGSTRSIFAYTDGWYQLVWAYPVADAETPTP